MPMSTSLFNEIVKDQGRLRSNGVALQADRLDYSLRRYFVDEFYFRHVPTLSAGSRVLDLGGTKVSKRGDFDIGRYDLRVIYANLSPAKQPDVQSDAAHLPVKQSCFDAVICSEVLEHVPDPLAVLRETHQVLRSQGVLLVCAPFLHHIHGDPHDYGRYTDQYWREALARIGFADIVIERQGLFWSVMVDMLRGWAHEHAKQGRPRSDWLRRQLAKVIAKGKRMALAWEAEPGRDTHPFFGSFTTGFGIRAVRP